MLLIYMYLIVVGLCFGSFVNALVWRLHDQAELRQKTEQGKKLTAKEQERLRALSISRGRSMCLNCGHELAAKDLIPVVSWLSLRGKCRYCGARIPDTPLAELLVPLLFVLSYAVWPFALRGWGVVYFVLWLACCVAFVALALYDLRWYLLPDRIVFPLIGIALLAVVAKAGVTNQYVPTIAGAGIGVLVVAGLFYGLFALSDGNWIGGGDVKLGVVLGLLAGGFFEGLLLILLASVFGLLAAVPQIARGKALGSTRIPFGPFLLLGAVTVVLLGTHIINWYTHLLVV